MKGGKNYSIYSFSRRANTTYNAKMAFTQITADTAPIRVLYPARDGTRAEGSIQRNLSVLYFVFQGIYKQTLVQIRLAL